MYIAVKWYMDIIYHTNVDSTKLVLLTMVKFLNNNFFLKNQANYYAEITTIKGDVNNLFHQ